MLLSREPEQYRKKRVIHAHNAFCTVLGCFVLHVRTMYFTIPGVSIVFKASDVDLGVEAQMDHAFLSLNMPSHATTRRGPLRCGLPTMLYRHHLLLEQKLNRKSQGTHAHKSCPRVDTQSFEWACGWIVGKEPGSPIQGPSPLCDCLN